MALLISDAVVKQLLTMADAIDMAERAVRELQEGKAENRPRNHFYVPGEKVTFMMRQFQGAIPKLGVFGLRVTTDIIGSVPHKPQVRPFGLFLLFDLGTAAFLAVIHDHELQRIRVGAETGVAARYLAREDAETVGLLGSGFQAETQLAAVCAVRKIERAEVYSPNPEHRRRFAREMGKRLGIEIVPVENPKEAVEEKDIVVAATNSSRPVLEGSWISEGAHVTSIVNSDQRFPRRELDNDTFARSDIVVIASLEQCQQDHAADIFESVEAGALSWKRVCELGEVVTGKRGRRNTPKQITLFKNNALAVEFTALAWRVFQIAQREGLGEEIPAHYFPGFKVSPSR
jgi:ornithine cyclodeaminase/alanine dehydrogenase-like protein (mu-crystallin family)